ncbi:DNA glycosylase [Cladochytrium replicatum]|nr:DNA glycosylase [Cladochytrium replicatum]
MAHSRSYHDWRSDDEIAELRKFLLAHYDKNQRILPWRAPSGDAAAKPVEDIDPGQRAYEVWVSEIMLQQTQVATVIPYYNTWMSRWPTVRDLANASLDDVNSVWAGLGYYSRAKRLHEAAKIVVDKFNGVLPKDPAVLIRDIPGVGPYSAGAISSIAYNVPAPLVDGNVVRVLSRVRAIAADPKKKAAIDLHWKLARESVDPDRPGHFNQALMEHGATVCTPQNPDCKNCPIKEICHAYAEQSAHKKKAIAKLIGAPKSSKPNAESSEPCDICTQEDIQDIESCWEVTRYPRKASRKPQREEVLHVAVIQDADTSASDPSVLIRLNPSKGLLANLWDFPNSATKLTIPSFIPRSSVQSQKHIGSAVHLFSHIRRTMEVHHVVVKGIGEVKDGWKCVKISEVEKSADGAAGAVAVPQTFWKCWGVVNGVSVGSKKKRKVVEQETDGVDDYDAGREEACDQGKSRKKGGRGVRST